MSVLSSLTNRIFLGTALLVVVAIGVAVYRVNVSVTAQADADLVRGLDEAATLVDEVSRRQFEDFARDARLIANLPVLRAAVATNDGPTVQPIAAEYQGEMKAALFIVLDRSSRVLAAAAGRPDLQAPGIVGEVLAARGRASAATWFWTYPGGVLLVTAAPMEFLGALVVATVLDQPAAERIKAVTNSDIALVAGGRIVVSTLEPARTAALAASVGRSGASNAFNVSLGGEQFVARTQALEPVAGADRLSAIVLRSRTAQTRFLQPLHREVALTGLLGVLVATLLSYGIARSVTRPLRAVTATMREMAATGNLTAATPAMTKFGGWVDEDARLLGSTFQQLTTSLDRFQREAAQRERLSSLGRLSTVIAHEIRNPLMIITMALHDLRKAAPADATPGADSPAARAAASIAEEVTRLNALVSGVLDFAKPIAFALGPADLIEVCRGAAQAVAATGAPVDVRLDAPGGTATIRTDAERVRGVLVNVLTNAQQALAVAGVTAPIALRLGRADGQWRIEVADAGPGLSADDLARVFEPFFTTRRGGTGLGLAIARNVIDGLGGTITMQSAPGQGTTVTIALPDVRS